MMRSMYAAVSGLRNHQTRMDVIGNNIANVNTVGFKKSRVTFKDAFSQVLKGASRPQGGLGGTNPMQVGLGLVIGSIDTIHSKGNAQGTGNMTDLAIDGEGFFLLDSGSGSILYSRAGIFDFDGEGNFVNNAGLKVQGWYLNEQGERVRGQNDNTVDPAAPPSSLKLISQLAPPKATSQVFFTGNLDTGAANELQQKITEIGETADPEDMENLIEMAIEEASFSRSFTVYDQKGKDYNVNMKFVPVVDDESGNVVDNKWKWIIKSEDGNSDIQGVLIFSEDGELQQIEAAPSEAGSNWTVGDDSITGFQVSLNFVASDGGETTQMFDFSGLTQYADPRGESTMKVQQDGYTYGTLEEVVVDDKGIITGSYSNGTSHPLMQIALATFSNPGGLMGLGNTLYTLSGNSGEPEINAPGQGKAGSVAPSSLEMSNVDLSEEFTDMIVTQRGFQANSRVITVSDEMLQELVNIKR